MQVREGNIKRRNSANERGKVEPEHSERDTK